MEKRRAARSEAPSVAIELVSKLVGGNLAEQFYSGFERYCGFERLANQLYSGFGKLANQLYYPWSNNNR